MKKIGDLEALLKQPLQEDEIRKRADGAEYIGIGDVLLNLRDDVGPLNYDWAIERLEYRDPREDVREKIDQKTGVVLKREVGWTAFAFAVGKLTIRFESESGGWVTCVRMGAGTASSDMQPFPEMALENAIKACESDALKRAVVGLGPRYGLALRFDAKRGDDRRELGMTAPDPVAQEKLDRARAARDAAKAKAAAAVQTNVTPGGNPSHSPRAGAPGVTPSNGAAPAAATGSASAKQATPSQASPVGPGPAAAGSGVAGAAAPPAAAKPPAPAPAPERTTEAALASGDTLTGDEAKRAQAAIDAEAVKAQAAAAARRAEVQALEAAAAARLETIMACRRGEVPAWLTERLAVGVFPSDELGGQDLPDDPADADLQAVGWDGPGVTIRDLCALGMAEPLPQPMVKALVEEATRRLGDRKTVGRLWKALAVGGKDAPSYGYNSRLFAWVVGSLTPAPAKVTK